MKKTLRVCLLVLLALVVAAVLVAGGLYFTRFQTLGTIEKLTDYTDGYNIYEMDVKYAYSLDNILNYGITDNQTMIDAILAEALPGLPVSIKAPSFGCSAFTMVEETGHVRMGRNYDFKKDSSAMLVYCAPKDGYRSVATAALDNVSANQPEQSMKKKLASLTAPFICLDGLNEKGVSIAVLTLDSEPTFQQTGKTVITTTLAIRLVLDRAATTQEAVELLKNYDMFASSGKDYHFYITDASGDGRVIEYDCDDPARPLVDTPIRAITNFYGLYADRVQPNQRNGIYGHGKERWERMEAVFAANEGSFTQQTGWEALRAASQLPNPQELTSNTQWSILYDNTALTGQIVLRRNWEDVVEYAVK